MTFDHFNIDKKCLDILNRQSITVPTPVQAQAIPAGLEGRDVLAIAQTGTGKTLAFGLPALTRLAAGTPGRNRMLVLTPTRELAVQVHESLVPFGRALGLRTTCIYGGAGMEPQVRALRRGCDVIVATPGRLLDHMGQGNINFSRLEVLVLDEADRMLDMGFLPDIRRILKAMPTERQTLLFSATFPRDIEQLTSQFQRDVFRVDVAPQHSAAETVSHRIFTVHQDGKIDLLSRVLSEEGVDSAIVFIRTKHRTDRIARQLEKQGFNAQAIHGGRSQAQRQRALDGFKAGRFNVLVATDVAARGIDVQGITHVVNFDIPKDFDDYVHRIGRTGRANASGAAVTFVSPQDMKELGSIERGLGRNLPREEWEGAINVLSLFRQGGAPRPGRRPGHGPTHAGPEKAAAKKDTLNPGKRRPGSYRRSRRGAAAAR
jgi:ATP-dependent RNA helicase RhlE